VRAKFFVVSIASRSVSNTSKEQRQSPEILSNLRKSLLCIFRDRFLFTKATESSLSLPPHYAITNVYVLSSLLQKAVRRGELDVARKAGHALLSRDPMRVWRRLCVTALEDIGIGDPDVAADMIGIASYSEIRRELGGNPEALDELLRRACGAVKDRSADHFHSIAERDPETRVSKERLRQASDNALLAVVASEKGLIDRTVAAALFHARNAETAALRRVTLPRIFDLFEDMGAPTPLLAACRLYAWRELDPLPVYTLLAWALARGVAETVRSHDRLESPLIDGLPAYGFDPHHTRTGRRAVQLWHRSYLKAPPWSARQIGMALWNVEAAACDRTLAWEPGAQIRRQAYRADLLGYGVPEAQHNDLYMWVIQERDALTSARQAAWRSAVGHDG
jgi:hypothetical protein